jgi:hypothetical protein
MANRTLTRWLRISVALVAFLFGVLVLASGIVGPEPIGLGGSEHGYYRVVATPPPYYWLWGSLSLLLAIALFIWPSLSKGKN